MVESKRVFKSFDVFRHFLPNLYNSIILVEMTDINIRKKLKEFLTRSFR